MLDILVYNQDFCRSQFFVLTNINFNLPNEAMLHRPKHYNYVAMITIPVVYSQLTVSFIRTAQLRVAAALS